MFTNLMWKIFGHTTATPSNCATPKRRGTACGLRRSTQKKRARAGLHRKTCSPEPIDVGDQRRPNFMLRILLRELSVSCVENLSAVQDTQTRQPISTVPRSDGSQVVLSARPKYQSTIGPGSR